MEVKTLNGKKVKYYESIEDLPIVNYQKFNKYVLYSTHVGNDINSLVQHLANVIKLVDFDKNKAKIELNNQIQSLLFMENNVNTDLMAFACLIHSIDGEPVTDLSDSNLKVIIDSLKEEKFSVIKKLLEAVKKKLTTELEAYYPETFNLSTSEQRNRTLLIRYNKLSLRLILTENEDEREELKAQIQSLIERLYKQYQVISFVGKDNYEIKHDKTFESSCLAIAQETGLDPYKLTVLQFYGLLENLHKQAKQKLKASKKHG